MKVSKIVSDYMYLNGIDTVFAKSGGGYSYIQEALLNDNRIKIVNLYHEQAAAMAAAAYSKYKNAIGCVITGNFIGGSNMITGALEAWQDSTACIFITEYDNQEVITDHTRIDGKANLLGLVSPIMKYAVTVENVNDLLYHLEKARYLAVTGRKGPVWIGISNVILNADAERNQMRIFQANELEGQVKTTCTKDEIENVINKLKEAKRPLVLAGQGIHLADAREEFKEFIDKFRIPVVYTELGVDILPLSHPLSIGKIGSRGSRAGNFALQNADFILVVGSRLSTGSTGYKYELFARKAVVYTIDIDENEHKKDTVKIDTAINCDAKRFLSLMNQQNDITSKDEWVSICQRWKKNYPVYSCHQSGDEDGVEYYSFMKELSNHLKEDSVVVADASSSFTTSQSLSLNSDKQRYITSGAQAAMGFSLCAAIGISAARDKKDVIAISGDGSMQMNIRELQTLAREQFPIKLFIWSNGGYMSIRNMMLNQFEGRVIGTDASSGLSIPDMEKISDVYDIKYLKMDSIKSFDEIFHQMEAHQGPVICEVICKKEQELLMVPGTRILYDGKLVNVPLEDMSPFLPENEFKSNMVIESLY